MYVCMYVCIFIKLSREDSYIHALRKERVPLCFLQLSWFTWFRAHCRTSQRHIPSQQQKVRETTVNSTLMLPWNHPKGICPAAVYFRHLLKLPNGSLKIPTSILFESLRLATHKAIFSVTAKTSCLHTHRNHQSLQDLARVSCMSVLSQYWKQHLPIYPGPFWHGKPPGPSAAAWSPLLWRRRAVMISGVERTCSGQIRRFFLGRLSWKKKVRKWKLQYFNSPTSSCLLLFVASQFSYWWFHVMPPFSIHSWVGQLPLTAGKNVSASTWACPKHSAWCGGSPQSFTFRRAI